MTPRREVGPRSRGIVSRERRYLASGSQCFALQAGVATAHGHGCTLVDTLVLGGALPGGEQRWSYPRVLSDGSTRPDWFLCVAAGFLGAVTGAVPDRDNLAEAALCVTLGALARESSREKGRTLPVVLPSLGPWRSAAAGGAQAGRCSSPRRPAAHERGP